LAFVLPAAWEYALYADQVRQHVLGNFQSVDVHRCLQPLFTDVREGCVVLWLFNPVPGTLRKKSVRAYLEHGERVCDLNAYKLKHRDPWYEVPDIRNATGFLSGMTRLGPWISFRSMRHLAATNTLYVLTAKNKMSADERASWALSLLSTSSRRQFSELARRYPDGLAKLEPHDINSFQLTPPKSTAGAAGNYLRAVDILLASKVSEAVTIADAQIGGKCT
jgi:hypothetical protein